MQHCTRAYHALLGLAEPSTRVVLLLVRLVLALGVANLTLRTERESRHTSSHVCACVIAQAIDVPIVTRTCVRARTRVLQIRTWR